MTLLDSLSSFFTSGGNKKAASTDRKNPTGYEVSAYSGYDLSTGENKRELLDSMNGWVYACVNAICDEMGNIQLSLYRQENNGDVTEVDESPILDVLYKVNNFTTKFDHFWLTQAYLELAGESPWFIEKTDGVPTAIYFLKPDRITPIPDKNKVISGYSYMVDAGDRIPLSIDEVIFLKNPNPANPFRGKGTLENASITVDLDNTAEKWNYEFFKNSARPDSVMTVKNMQQMKEEQKEKLKKSIELAHKGVDKAHKLMVLFGDMEITKFGSTQADMEFGAQQAFSRDKIMAMFRVPKAIIALTEGVNYASAKASLYTFSRFTITPKMERIVQQLNEFFIPMFPDSENLFLDFKSPVQEDEAVNLAKYSAGLASGWLTVNEVRSFEGMEPLEGFDVPYLPLNLYPVGGESTLPPLPPEGDVNPTEPVAPEDTTTVEEDPNAKKKFKFSNKTIERLRQMKARSRPLIDFDKKVADIEKKIKVMVKDEMKKSGKKITDKRIKDISDSIKKTAGLDKKTQTKNEKIKLVIVKDTKTAELYESKLNEVDAKLKHLEKLENDKIVAKKQAEDERQKLEELRKQIVSEYNSQQDAE